jgi:hypothetical protein
LMITSNAPVLGTNVIIVQFLTAVSMKMIAFLAIAPCCLVEAHRRFRGEYCALLIEAVCVSETSVYFNEITRCCMPEV